MKKAFTLVEVLATIIILAIIMTIIVPNVNKIITNAKKNSQDNLVKFIYKSTERYVIDNNIVITPTSDECIQISTLKNSGYLKDKDIKDATDGEFLDDYCVRVSLSNNQNEYDLKPGTTLGEILFNNSETGLVEDTYEAGRYYYSGANPNNYITLNESTGSTTYRIISYEADGTIKVIRNESIGKMAWDTAALRSEDDNTFCTCNGPTKSCEGDIGWGLCIPHCANNNADRGCNAWGNMTNTYRNNKAMNDYFSFNYYENYSDKTITIKGIETGINKTTVIQDSSLNQYLNNTFLNTNLANVSKFIDDHLWDVGGATQDENFEKSISETKLNKWRGKIALLSVIDYIKASDNSECENIVDKKSYVHSTGSEIYYYCSQNSEGISNNYLFINVHEWTLTPIPSETNSIWEIPDDSGIFMYPYQQAYLNYAVRPSFYLKSSIKLTGTGTSTDPYTILN